MAAYANGRIPLSALDPIPGTSTRPGKKPLLRADAARAWNALHRYSMHRWGISMAITEESIRRAYRELAAQQLARRYWCARGACGNAAVPGTSNHGLAITVDLLTRQQRWVVDQVGHLFGFSKRWSDAAWEWWHIKYRPGHYSMVSKWGPTSYPTLRKGARGAAVKRLQKRLRHHKADTQKGALPVDGVFGNRTVKAVKHFQKTHKLKADGIVGPATWKKLRKK